MYIKYIILCNVNLGMENNKPTVRTEIKNFDIHGPVPATNNSPLPPSLSLTSTYLTMFCVCKHFLLQCHFIDLVAVYSEFPLGWICLCVLRPLFAFRSLHYSLLFPYIISLKFWLCWFLSTGQHCPVEAFSHELKSGIVCSNRSSMWKQDGWACVCVSEFVCSAVARCPTDLELYNFIMLTLVTLMSCSFTVLGYIHV